MKPLRIFTLSVEGALPSVYDGCEPLLLDDISDNSFLIGDLLCIESSTEVDVRGAALYQYWRVEGLAVAPPESEPDSHPSQVTWVVRYIGDLSSVFVS